MTHLCITHAYGGPASCITRATTYGHLLPLSVRVKALTRHATKLPQQWSGHTAKPVDSYRACRVAPQGEDSLCSRSGTVHTPNSSGHTLSTLDQ